jgi:DNA-binding MarR family transcriptional regulator
MYYNLAVEMIGLIKMYEEESAATHPDLQSFGLWLNNYLSKNGYPLVEEPHWPGKEKGRSADSFINTSLVHLYRYAKMQAKAAIADTTFSTLDDFIYLISLVSLGSMTKSELIKLNVHEKSAGMQIVNRLIANGMVEQNAIETDKRNRMIDITQKGRDLLNESMQNIRHASKNVTEPLSEREKLDLIKILGKLENFHEQKYRSA